jgi:type IV secretion system protein VirB10
MSQTQPPQAPRDGDADPSQNPYYQQARAPDLDAGAPTLQAEEAQRLNRKALFFLGATLLVVLVMGFLLVFGRGGSEGGPPERQVEARQVIIPDGPGANLPQFPQDAPVAASLPPIPVEDEFAADRLVLPPTPAMQPPPPVDAGPRQPTLVERRIADNANVQAGGSGAQASSADPYSGLMSEIQALEARQAGGAASTAAPASARPSRDGDRPVFLANPDAKLVRGTYLRCVMETRIISDLPGFSSCIVTEPVYSFNGKRLLIPKGSKIYGQYGQGDFMNDRMAVVWDRILTPHGVDISISAPGVDNLGSTGVPGQYDAHWASRITSALMISLLSDTFKYAAAEYGPETTGVTVGGFVTQQPFESNTAKTIEQLAAQAVEENSKRPPTVTINQGSVINIYVTQDIDFASVLP